MGWCRCGQGKGEPRLGTTKTAGGWLLQSRSAGSRHHEPALRKSAVDRLIEHRIADWTTDFLRQADRRPQQSLWSRYCGSSRLPLAALTRRTLWMAICKASNPTLDAAACTGHNN
jgi:hypothetical protein